MAHAFRVRISLSLIDRVWFDAVLLNSGEELASMSIEARLAMSLTTIGLTAFSFWAFMKATLHVFECLSRPSNPIRTCRDSVSCNGCKLRAVG